MDYPIWAMMSLLIALCAQEDWPRARARFLKEGPPAIPAVVRADRAEAVDLLVRALADAERRGDTDAVAQLLQGLSSFRSPSAVHRVLEEAVASRSERFRETAWSAARHFPLDERGRGLLLHAVRRETSVIARVAAIESAAARGWFDDAMADAAVDPHWRVRRAAAWAVALLDRAEAIPRLIEALEGEGPIRGELNRALVVLTGADKHGDAAAWRSWWEEEGRDRDRPARADREAAAERSEDPPGTRAEFYGARIDSRRVFFLLDISGSMDGAKLRDARREVRRALEALPPDATFGLGVFADEFEVWETGARATREKRREALEWLESRDVGEGTRLQEALEGALVHCGAGRRRLAADTIYLVTDGRLVAGFRDLLLRRLRERNPHALVRLHAVPVGKDADRGFLGRLAAENGGSLIPPGR